jgi:Rrf2 family transcriptional regulator, iron-sulfur cluster assembly transcription factor
MQFTKAESYGIRGVIYLAEQANDRIVPLSEIATAEDVPEKFLAKIFQNLNKVGIIKSHRGIKGGFTLMKSPDKVTARDVVEAIQGEYILAKCLRDPDCCDKYSNCPVRVILERAEKELLRVFEAYSISDMIRFKNDLSFS